MQPSHKWGALIAFVLCTVASSEVASQTKQECLRSAEARLLACYEACYGTEGESDCRRSCKDYYSQQVQSCKAADNLLQSVEPDAF